MAENGSPFKNQSARPLAVTMGEPAGVGPDIILAAHQAMLEGDTQASKFLVFGDTQTFASRAAHLGYEVDVQRVDPDAFDACSDSMQIVQCGRAPTTEPGTLNASGVETVLTSLDSACRAVADSYCSGLVTAPIHKSHLYRGGFAFPGHTEYLEHFARGHAGNPSTEAVMMLAGPELRTVPITVHAQLKSAILSLSTQRIVRVARIVHEDLIERFNIPSPRLVVAGLNPHAGENGELGDEEDRLIKPAIDELKCLGINVSGPYPADTLFHAEARSQYDVALCMYHDQALIPVKTLDFHGSVNVTLGLPFIRTSPDHGTALQLAGTGKASPSSLLAAIERATSMVEAQSKEPSRLATSA